MKEKLFLTTLLFAAFAVSAIAQEKKAPPPPPAESVVPPIPDRFDNLPLGKSGISSDPNNGKRFALMLLDSSARRSAGGSLVEIVGRIINTSGQPLKRVVVVGSLLDATGKLITFETSSIEFEPLRPNQMSPFKVLVRWNPLMKGYSVDFKDSDGNLLETRRPYKEDKADEKKKP